MAHIKLLSSTLICASHGYYLDLLEQQDGQIQKYDARLWHGMVDHMTVFSKDDFRFTMKDGTEVQA